jgi:uncharacterized protein YccT (UPF0319 family)
MKTTVLALITVGSTALSTVLHAENLNIPMVFEFLALDGQKVERSLVSHKSDLALTPGDHEIAIRYSDMVEGDITDTPESVKSAPFIITLQVEQGAEYLLRPAGGVRIREPFEFAKAPEIEITRTDGAQVTYSFTQTDISQRDFDTKLYGERLAPAATVAAAPAAAEAAAQGVPAGGAAEEIYALDVVGDKEVTAVEGGQGASPEQMLRLWWERADEQTRKDFLGWAIKQL